MAYIGKNGKDGKDGKDDCSRLAGFAAVGLMANIDTTAANIPTQRRFCKVQMTGIGQIPADLRERSNDYWEQAYGMGLVDSTVTRANGDTTIVLSVTDEAEARTLVEGDPVVAAGHVGNIAYAVV